jgi:hypothetical protein
MTYQALDNILEVMARLGCEDALPDSDEQLLAIQALALYTAPLHIKHDGGWRRSHPAARTPPPAA